VAHLEPGNAAVDRRHDRRELDADELRRLLAAARDSDRPFRGLTGRDRSHLYATACGSSFRASGLASLTPESLDLDTEPPTVTLAARENKSRKTKVQPLPPDVADLLRDYLRDRPAGQPIWGGTWASDRVGAAMLRIDLAGAVEKLPRLLPAPDNDTEAAHFRATGTDASAVMDGACSALAVISSPEGDGPGLMGTPARGEGGNATGPNPLILQGVAAGGDSEGLPGTRAGDRIRTDDVQLGKTVRHRAEKPRNPCQEKSLRPFPDVCKGSCTLASGCKEARNFRRKRGVRGRCAEDARKNCGSLMRQRRWTRLLASRWFPLPYSARLLLRGFRLLLHRFLHPLGDPLDRHPQRLGHP
jgi:hypothetical protein